MLIRLLTVTLIVLTNVLAHAIPNIPYGGNPPSSEEQLAGHWTRVLDGCEDLTDAQLDKLSVSGGGNSMSRRIVISFGDGRFQSSMLPSLRCEKDFGVSGATMQGDQIYSCDHGYAEGGYRLAGPDKMFLVADRTEGRHTWGVVHQNWRYRVHGDALVLKNEYHGCPDGKLRVYLIRTPMN